MADPAAPQSARPASVAIAVKLLYATLALGLLQFALRFQTVDRTVSTVALIAEVTGLGFEWFLINRISNRRNWARITLLVLFVLLIPSSVLSFLSSAFVTATPIVLPSTVTLFEIIALVMLFTKSANAWFWYSAAQTRAPSPPAPDRLLSAGTPSNTQAVASSTTRIAATTLNVLFGMWLLFDAFLIVGLMLMGWLMFEGTHFEREPLLLSLLASIAGYPLIYIFSLTKCLKARTQGAPKSVILRWAWFPAIGVAWTVIGFIALPGPKSLGNWRGWAAIMSPQPPLRPQHESVGAAGNTERSAGTVNSQNRTMNAETSVRSNGVAPAPCCGTASKSGFAILHTTQVVASNAPGTSPGSISAFVGSRNGGFLMTGSTDSSHSWILSTTPTMTLQWARVIDQGWPAYGASFGLDAMDGGYWIVGLAYSRDIRQELKESAAGKARPWFDITKEVAYDYLLKLDPKGAPVWQRRASEGYSHHIYCGAETDDGLILVGWGTATYEKQATQTGSVSVTVPWIEKIDKTGKLVWQKLVTEDGDDLLMQRRNPGCNGLRISSRGTITWAFSVNPVPLQRAQDRTILPVAQLYRADHPETIILQLDPQGHELHRMRSQDADSVFLFAVDNGFSLVEHFRPHIPEKVKTAPPALAVLAVGEMQRAYATDGGARITSLDENLGVHSRTKYKIPPLSDRLEAVLPTNDGGYLLAGCDPSAVNTIARVNPGRGPTDVMKIFPEGAQQCGTFGLAPGATDAEVVLFIGNSLRGNRVLRIKYTQ